jgi:hypothetical protein
MTMAGAIPSASRSAVVERFAPIAVLAATVSAKAAIHGPTMSHDDLNTTFNMISTLLWIGVDIPERQSAHEIGRVPALASETG